MSTSVPPSAAAKRKDPPASLEVPSQAEESANEARKVTPTNAAAKTDDTTSPFETRVNELNALAKENNYILWDILPDNLIDRVPGKLKDFNVDFAEDLSEEDHEKALNTLTQDEVDKYVHYLIVPRAVPDLSEQLREAIMFADPRNNPGDGILMLNTYSSWCMYPIINKQLAAATKEINKAKKAVNNAGSAGIAKVALEKTLAAVFACDECDHWRLDTESPEDCEAIAKKVSKLLKDLLWFHDEELGLVDPYSRKTLLKRFELMKKDWNCVDYMDLKLNFLAKTNSNGMGRPKQAALPPTKKAKPTPVVASVASSGNAAQLVAYLSNIDDKIKGRVKTHVQLNISSAANPSKECRVVMSGATDLKKLGQLCAFLTGHLSEFQNHSQKGKSLKGSHFELRLGDSQLWIGEKALAKQAPAHVVDKTVKVVQLFQGLVVDPKVGMTYDSDTARTLATTPGSVVWAATSSNNDTASRYNITIEGILANKSVQIRPLPRIVTDDSQNNPNTSVGFGNKRIHATNRTLQGDRQGPNFIVMRGTSRAELSGMDSRNAARPICGTDGKVVNDDLLAKIHFSAENVQSAAPPTAS